MSAVIKLDEHFDAVSCADCGTIFGISNFYLCNRRRDHKTFYCPNGCKNYYPSENKIELLEKELTSVKHRLEKTLSRENEIRKKFESQSKRIKHGICPCCKRTFKQLSAHMLNKHPEWIQ